MSLFCYSRWSEIAILILEPDLKLQLYVYMFRWPVRNTCSDVK